MRTLCFTSAVVSLLLSVMVVQKTFAQSTDPLQRLKQLTTATSLDREGQHPWHLRISFDLYDLQGKKKESGTVEEWWVSSKSHRLVITSPSFKETIPSAKNESTGANREAFLVHSLLDQVVHPISDLGAFEKLEVQERPHLFAKVNLSCLIVTTPVPENTKTPLHSGPQFCTDPGTDVLRIRLDEGANLTVVRNRPGSFLNTSIALDNAILYGKLAITGHVDALETYDPSKVAVELTTSIGERKTVHESVIADHFAKKVQPEYPILARQEHLGGTVVLGAIISKQGTVSSLDIVASPDPLLSKSALDAVKHWVYAAYLLDGNPTEIDTTIVVHYNLSIR